MNKLGLLLGSGIGVIGLVFGIRRLTQKFNVTKKPRFIAMTVGDTGGNLPGESPDAIGWDGDKSAHKRADINNGLFK
jgi:hypothetical protein